MLTRRAFMPRSKLVERLPEEGSRKWLLAELDSLRMGLEKVTDEVLKEMLQQYKAMV
jgi:hypothetical protein